MQKGKMRFIEVETKNRTADFINRLLTVWESSVRATHLFLSDSEIKKIAVPNDIEKLNFSDYQEQKEKEAEKNAASSDADGDEKTDTSVNGALQRLEDDMVKMTINTGGSDMIFYLEKSDAVEMKAAKRAAEEEAEAADEETELETKKDTEKETKEETKKSEK